MSNSNKEMFRAIVMLADCEPFDDSQDHPYGAGLECARTMGWAELNDGKWTITGPGRISAASVRKTVIREAACEGKKGFWN